MGRGLDANWVSWVSENVERGCDIDELRATLKKEGFSNKKIIRIMDESAVNVLEESGQTELGEVDPKALKEAALASRFIDGEDIRSESNSEINYSALSKINLACPNIHPDITQIDNAKIQLFTWDNFLSTAECAALKQIINKHLRPSTVTVSNGDGQFRTSSTCDLSLFKDSFIKEIDEKIAKALGIYSSYSEGIQAQRYNVDQEFKAHTDYFEPGSKEFADFAGKLGQRTWTFMIYLQDTRKGGATKFVKLDKTFYPKQGQAVIWNNLDEFGRPNAETLHHGMKVKSGTKMIITKWFRDKGKGKMLYPTAYGGDQSKPERKKRFGFF